jgi:hypothetical protein
MQQLDLLQKTVIQELQCIYWQEPNTRSMHEIRLGHNCSSPLAETAPVCTANAHRNCRLTGSGMQALATALRRRQVPAASLQDEVQRFLRGVGQVLDKAAVDAAFGPSARAPEELPSAPPPEETASFPARPPDLASFSPPYPAQTPHLLNLCLNW